MPALSRFVVAAAFVILGFTSPAIAATPHPIVAMAFAPNSREVAFVTDGKLSLMLRGTSAALPQQLWEAEDRDDENARLWLIRWSPDGRQIAVWRMKSDVAVFDAKTLRVRFQARATPAVWWHNGTRCYVSGTEEKGQKWRCRHMRRPSKDWLVHDVTTDGKYAYGSTTYATPRAPRSKYEIWRFAGGRAIRRAAAGDYRMTYEGSVELTTAIAVNKRSGAILLTHGSADPHGVTHGTVVAGNRHIEIGAVGHEVFLESPLTPFGKDAFALLRFWKEDDRGATNEIVPCSIASNGTIRRMDVLRAVGCGTMRRLLPANPRITLAAGRPDGTAYTCVIEGEGSYRIALFIQ